MHIILHIECMYIYIVYIIIIYYIYNIYYNNIISINFCGLESNHGAENLDLPVLAGVLLREAVVQRVHLAY